MNAEDPPSAKKPRTNKSRTLPPAPWTLGTKEVKFVDRRMQHISFPTGCDLKNIGYLEKPWKLRTMHGTMQVFMQIFAFNV